MGCVCECCLEALKLWLLYHLILSQSKSWIYITAQLDCLPVGYNSVVFMMHHDDMTSQAKYEEYEHIRGIANSD